MELVSLKIPKILRDGIYRSNKKNKFLRPTQFQLGITIDIETIFSTEIILRGKTTLTSNILVEECLILALGKKI